MFVPESLFYMNFLKNRSSGPQTISAWNVLQPTGAHLRAREVPQNFLKYPETHLWPPWNSRETHLIANEVTWNPTKTWNALKRLWSPMEPRKTQLQAYEVPKNHWNIMNPTKPPLKPPKHRDTPWNALKPPETNRDAHVTACEALTNFWNLLKRPEEADSEYGFQFDQERHLWSRLQRRSFDHAEPPS